jgi:hypothetical protein
MGRPVQIGLGIAGIALGLVGMLALRDATLSRHEHVDPASRVALVVDASTEDAESSQTLQEMVDALLLTCRLEVAADIAGPIENEGDGRFRAVLAPALDESNRRQLRGCVEDWTIDHLLVDVVAFESSP